MAFSNCWQYVTEICLIISKRNMSNVHVHYKVLYDLLKINSLVILQFWIRASVGKTCSIVKWFTKTKACVKNFGFYEGFSSLIFSNITSKAQEDDVIHQFRSIFHSGNIFLFRWKLHRWRFCQLCKMKIFLQAKMLFFAMKKQINQCVLFEYNSK